MSEGPYKNEVHPGISSSIIVPYHSRCILSYPLRLSVNKLDLATIIRIMDHALWSNLFIAYWYRVSWKRFDEVRSKLEDQKVRKSCETVFR